MCILVGKQAKALRAELQIQVNEKSKLKAENAELLRQLVECYNTIANLQRAVADMEAELKERITDNHSLQMKVADRENTIKQVKYELAKYKPKRDSKGKFAKKC